jgi:hypothetical protein
MRPIHAEKECQALFGFFVGPTQLPLLTSGRSYAASLLIVAAEIIVIGTAIVACSKAYTVLPRLIPWRMTTTSIISSSIRYATSIFSSNERSRTRSYLKPPLLQHSSSDIKLFKDLSKELELALLLAHHPLAPHSPRQVRTLPLF